MKGKQQSLWNYQSRILVCGLKSKVRTRNSKEVRVMQGATAFLPWIWPASLFSQPFGWTDLLPDTSGPCWATRRGWVTQGLEALQKCKVPFSCSLWFFPFQRSWQSGVIREGSRVFLAPESHVSNLPGNRAQRPCIHLPLQHEDSQTAPKNNVSRCLLGQPGCSGPGDFSQNRFLGLLIESAALNLLLSPSYKLLRRMSQWKQEIWALVSSKARKITLIFADRLSPDGRESVAETTDTIWKPAHPSHPQLVTLSGTNSAPQAPQYSKPSPIPSSSPGCRVPPPPRRRGQEPPFPPTSPPARAEGQQEREPGGDMLSPITWVVSIWGPQREEYEAQVDGFFLFTLGYTRGHF